MNPRRTGIRASAASSGYSTNGRPDRPGFRCGPITLCGWITALAWDALRSVTLSLPKAFHLAHPRTLCRWVLERDAELLLTRTCANLRARTHLLVVLASRTGRLWLLPLLRAFNAMCVSLPWLAGRTVAIGFVPPPRTSCRRAARARDAEVSYERLISPAGVWC